MNRDRKTKLKWNTTSSLCFRIITILSGFVLPKLILDNYGSEVNGLINSITQFLQIISLMELGVGAVVKSSLYKPLAENDINKVSQIVHAAKKFFRNVATIILVYIGVLIILYPYISKSNVNFFYSTVLILAMSISYFAQYYFGIVNRVLLVADQKGYVADCIQIIMLIINTISCVILIKMGSSIQVVKIENLPPPTMSKSTSTPVLLPIQFF